MRPADSAARSCKTGSGRTPIPPSTGCTRPFPKSGRRSAMTPSRHATSRPSPGAVTGLCVRTKHQSSCPAHGRRSVSHRDRSPPPPSASVAVLPFVNISGDPDNEYFSDGLTEELLNVLTNINELKVAARTSSFHFKGRTGDIADIASQLGVASILEGSVRQSKHANPDHRTAHQRRRWLSPVVGNLRPRTG